MGKIGAILLAIGLVIVGIVGLAGGTWVNTNEIAIVKHMDGSITTLSAGWNWTGFGISVDKLPIGKQSIMLSNVKSESFNGEDTHWQIGTGDGQTLDVNTNLVWRIDPSKAKELYLAMGGKDITAIEATIVEPQMKNVVQGITHTYNWNDIYGAKQSEVTAKINQQLSDDLSKDGIIIDANAFGFSHINPPNGMADAQAQLATAELAKQKALADQATQQVANQTKIMNADADTQVAIKQAEGQKAQAQAITQTMVDMEYAKGFSAHWDGKLPQVSAGGSGSILNIPAITPAK